MVAMSSMALRAVTFETVRAERGQAKQPGARCEPAGLGVGGVGFESGQGRRLSRQAMVGGDLHQPVCDVLGVYTQGVVVADDGPPGDAGGVLVLGGPDLQAQREFARQAGAGGV